VIDASGTTCADITVSVSASDAQAWVALGDALISATGFSASSPLPTTQSRAFLRTPGTPWAYSGLEITTPSAAPSWKRNLATTGSRDVLVDVWIEGRQQLELVVDRYVHRSGGEPRHGPDDRAVGRGAPRLPEMARIRMSLMYSTQVQT
jgi:hypothetical protein